MQRLLLSLFVVLVGCLAIPANLHAQDAADYFNSGYAWARKGDYDKAIADYDQSLLLIDPKEAVNISHVYYNRGNAWASKNEFDKAIADFTEAIRLTPDYTLAYYYRGKSWMKKCDYDKAIADYHEFLRINPSDGKAYGNRGIAWEKKGEYDKAIADYNQALRLIDSKDATSIANVYVYRGFAWDKKGDYDKAITDFNEAIRLNPAYADVYAGLARFEATCPDEKYRDGKRAVENANEAYQLTDGKDWNCIGALAAAYAESGDFEKAKEWQAKAIELAKSDKTATDKDKAEASSCLELYKQGKPYHEELKKK